MMLSPAAALESPKAVTMYSIEQMTGMIKKQKQQEISLRQNKLC